jgi:hypothetical protein
MASLLPTIKNQRITTLMSLTRQKNPVSALVYTVLVSLYLLPVSAQAFDITPFTGYRFGGEFEDINTGSELKLSEEQTYGVVLDWQRKEGEFVEFYYSRQPSSLLASGTITPGALFDIDVEYYHLGGKYRMKSNPSAFYLGSFGLTRFDAEVDGAGPETKFSLGLGVGIETATDKRVGFRLEGRAFGTFIDSSGGIFCGGGGCIIATESQMLWQFEVNAGITFRF